MTRSNSFAMHFQSFVFKESDPHTSSEFSSPSGTLSAPTTGGSDDFAFLGKGVKPLSLRSANKSARFRLFTMISPLTTPRMNRTLLSTFNSSYCRFSS
jgi:hypothetical protein